jgi:hypothetical protein
MRPAGSGIDPTSQVTRQPPPDTTNPDDSSGRSKIEALWSLVT